jgi:hypothetical protein
MASNEIWQTIEIALSQLHSESRYKPFYPLLEKLQRCVNARAPYSPEIIQAFIELIKRMSVELDQGRSITEVLDQTLSGYIFSRVGMLIMFFKRTGISFSLY